MRQQCIEFAYLSTLSVALRCTLHYAAARRRLPNVHFAAPHGVCLAALHRCNTLHEHGFLGAVRAVKAATAFLLGLCTCCVMIVRLNEHVQH